MLDRRSTTLSAIAARCCVSLLAVAASLFDCPAHAGKVGVHGIYMVPQNNNARDFSSPGWGAGAHVMVPVPVLHRVFAFAGGFDLVNLQSESIERFDPDTMLRTEQITNQTFVRVFAGGQLGGHGHGFLRPHAGINVAVVVYSVSARLRIPNDSDPDNSIEQNLSDESSWNFGFDTTLGLDLNFFDLFHIDGGVRYIKAFGVPQQLQTGLIDVHPDYFQIYLGLGANFNALRNLE